MVDPLISLRAEEFQLHGGDLPPLLLQSNSEGMTIGEAMAKINDLDLNRVKKKLCFPKAIGGKAWSAKKADEVEKKYKYFLKQILFDKGDDCLNEEVDEMWHVHILDTKKYFEDCKNVFGHYIHHIPNLDRESAVAGPCQNGCSKSCFTQGSCFNNCGKQC